MLIDEYKDLVPSNNITKPKYMAYLDAILTPIIQLGAVEESIGYAFDVQSAAGNQLDIIGELVGISRLLPVTPSVGDRMMNDKEFLMCILLKIAQNEWDGTNESAAKLYQEIVGENFSVRFVDNQDMTVDIEVIGAENIREAEVLFLSDAILVPAGVKAKAMIIQPEVNIETKYLVSVFEQFEFDPVKMAAAPVQDNTVGTIQNRYVMRVQLINVEDLEE